MITQQSSSNLFPLKEKERNEREGFRPPSSGVYIHLLSKVHVYYVKCFQLNAYSLRLRPNWINFLAIRNNQKRTDNFPVLEIKIKKW
jgi:hypothetical protein